MRSNKYILFVLALIVSVGTWGQYNPSNPAEPGAPMKQYVLTLEADPAGGGSFTLNATSNHVADDLFMVQTNAASANFTFVEWTQDGEVISTDSRFQYKMPARDVKLIAHYRYTPSSPTEPSEPNLPPKPVYSNLWLTAQPSSGGSFNIASGTSYEVGASVRVQANVVANFTFKNWTLDGEVISETNVFNYVMREGVDANRLVANFAYTPGSPGEPPLPKIYHRVYLMADPVGGGYFNLETGNQFEEGTQQKFIAYNNQWYTFQNWTIDGEVVSTSNTYTMTIPDKDVTLKANYTFEYNPANPKEPSQSTTKYLNVYGMTENGVRGQTITYPVLLENTEDVYGVTVVIHFPEGFTVDAVNTTQAERAAGHTLNVEALDDNAYRFDLTATNLLTDQNGKIFEVPVTISADCDPDQSYPVTLTNAARINLDGSREVINTRSGYIFVEDVKENGLYAQFSYEKLQGRVKFNNLSSAKALSYQWDFGDGSSSTEKSPMHIYAASGNYDVTLTVNGETGSDVAKMTVLINDESTWVVNGVFFLDTEVKGVRYFTSAQELFDYMNAKPITGDLKVSVKSGTTFDYALTEENVQKLTSIQLQLANGGFTLTIDKNGEGGTPVLNFGAKNSTIDDDVVNLFVNLGKNMVCNDVTLQLWGIGFYPTNLDQLTEQTVRSGSPTTEVDFTPVSTDLTFTWTATSDTETATGYLASGTGNIPSMTIDSGSAADCHIIYNIVASYQGTKFWEMTHTITLQPTLEGQFSNLQPTDRAVLEMTTVTLSWNQIKNAVYDVYLWNAVNQRPTTPVAEGITDLSYTSKNFCQNKTNYKWQVIARNGTEEMASDIMNFSIELLPDLHVYDLQASSILQAGEQVTIEWTVRNDGADVSEGKSWKDRLWLVPDVYGGTDQSKCQLLATVPNVKVLAAGEEYTGSVTITFDEETYGNYYLLVASDMSSVTQIDWAAIGGSIVNPYQPVYGGNVANGTYPYLYATTTAAGNQLKEDGETTTRSDNFFYWKVEIVPPRVNEADWQILKETYQEMGDGEGWTAPWNFDSEWRPVSDLPGVQLRGGRVVSINLSDNNLSGTFPTTLLKLECLETLNVGNNDLTGDLGQTMEAFMAENPELEITLKTLNVSNSNYSGNIGLFAQYFPHLESLNAQDNRLGEVSPMIAPTVTDLKLGNQKIDQTMTLHLNNLTADALMAQVPTILLYDHAGQTYLTHISLLCTTNDQSREFQMTCQDGELTIPDATSQDGYYGQSGDVLSVAVVDADGQLVGSSFNMKIEFELGDANIDDVINVQDLQTIIRFTSEDYKTCPFNYATANLWSDEVIDVQDVEKMADVLLAIDDEASGSETGGEDDPESPATDASIYIKQGQLWIGTAIPVAAFELTLSNADIPAFNEQLEQMGFTCRGNSKNGITRIVGYSMSGNHLPKGETVIASVQPLENDVQLLIKDVVFADAAAGTITVKVEAPVTVTAKSYEIEYGDDLPAFEFSSEGAYLVGTPAIVCDVPEGAPAGTYPIVISKGTLANYNATYVNGTLTIKKAMVTITADDIEVHQDEEMPTLTWKAEGWKKGEDESVLTTQPVCVTEGTPDSPLGDYTITISGAEAANYEFTYVDGTLTVSVPVGIADINANVAPADIYTLQGIKVRSKSENLDGLPSGYYIVNRRKVFIRRR